MSLKKLFSKMRKRSASNHEDDELSESTDGEPVCKHPSIDSESECRTTESDSTTSSGELSLRHESSTSALKNKIYKQNMGYKPEYKRAHWWDRNYESMNSLELTKMPLSKRKWLRKLIGMEPY